MSFDPQPWLDDFHQALSEMSSHYANLVWAVEDRKMDLQRLRIDTEAKLRVASDENNARRVLEQFIASFGDGHLEIEWPKSSAQPKPPASPPQSLCDRLGYKTRLHPGLDFSELSEFFPLDTPEAKFFPGGLLRLRSGTVFGVIRIGLFSEHSYPEVCAQAVRDLRVSETAECDEKCEDQVQLATANLLTSALVKRAAALGAVGATALLIDITHNGGGSDWVDAPPRALSSVPLRDSKMAFIKHEHWTKELQDRLGDVQTDIQNRAGSAQLLDAAVSKLEKAIDASKQPCNATGVWNTGKLNCSPLVKELLFASGILDYAKPGSLASLQSRTVLFYPSRYAYSESPKALPLYVVVDRETWSAAEYFAALLQDNHAATIVGEVTGGAGCGYTNGGIPSKLKNSGAQLEMPDCVRFRADGSNEVNGITPDVLLPWAEHDSAFQRAKKLHAALEARQAVTAKLPMQ
ncbi:MAG TPA: S41 family peptidase [Candidatus Binatia bacterium]|nr:S41 family peptidase [Candidatus Binatia bacterium]